MMQYIEYVLILFAYLLLPILLTFLYLQGAFDGLSVFLVISRVAGIFAFVWFSLQFIITARFKLLDKISGQDRLLSFHMIIAIATLVISFVHSSFGDEESGEALQSWFGGMGQDIFLYVSIFSALFFSNFFIRYISFLIPIRDKVSKILHLSYERCLWLHYSMPLAMALVLVHVLLLPGKGLFLFKTCMSAIGIAGLTSYVWHKFAVPFFLKRSPWKVSEIIKESDSVVTLAFDATSGKNFKYHPGQFCYVQPLKGNLPRQAHPFTISSAPNDPHLTITVKNLGDFTAQLNNIGPGSLFCLDGAYGRFSCRHVSKNKWVVFIAGGIGVTPMLSMLRYLAVKEPKRKATLIWGVRESESLIRRTEIEKLSHQMEDFVFIPIVSNSQKWNGRKGRIDKALLSEVFKQRGFEQGTPEIKDVEFFVCGPPPMTASVRRALIDLGVNNHRLHTEQFAF